MRSHAVVDGKIANKVPVEQIVQCAQARGLIAVIEGDTLHITKLQAIEEKPKQKQKQSQTQQEKPAEKKGKPWHERRGKQRRYR